jgi:DNA-binding transcriptional LysR family regulator
MGVAVVSRWVADKALELGSIAAIEVDGFPAQRPLYAVLPRGTRTRAAEAFLEHLRTAFSESLAGTKAGT